MEGLFPQILDFFQGLKIGVPIGCPGETLICKYDYFVVKA